MKFFIGLMVSLLLYGCCSPSYVVKQIDFKPPPISWEINTELLLPSGPLEIVRIDTIYGTITEEDTLFPVYRGIHLNEKGDTSVIAKFFLEDHRFEIDYFPDTIKIIDTIEISSSDFAIRGDSLWEKLVWILSGLLASGIIFYFKRKKKNEKITK